MNPGGVRADFVFADSAATRIDGRVSYEEAFTVQPFNNLVATQTFTGAQLLEVLKDQWCGSNSSATVLLPSATPHLHLRPVDRRRRSSASRAPGPRTR